MITRSLSAPLLRSGVAGIMGCGMSVPILSLAVSNGAPGYRRASFHDRRAASPSYHQLT
jgi:hypothetical protein